MSRGIDSLRTLPRPAWTSMIVSAREGPAWLRSIELPRRASEPRTRIVLPVSRLPFPASDFFALSDTPVWTRALTRMRPRRVIGIDAGGTKLLGGVVDEGLVVHHRVHRTWRGSDRRETLDIFVEAVEEVRAAAPDVEAVGFGIPALVEWETGVARWST